MTWGALHHFWCLLQALGVIWACPGLPACTNELFDTPAGAAAPVSGPGRGGGGLEVRRPVATCGGLWQPVAD